MCYSEPITNYFSTCSATANAEFQTPFANLGTSYLGVPLQSSQLKGVGVLRAAYTSCLNIHNQRLGSQVGGDNEHRMPVQGKACMLSTG